MGLVAIGGEDVEPSLTPRVPIWKISMLGSVFSLNAGRDGPQGREMGRDMAAGRSGKQVGCASASMRLNKSRLLSKAKFLLAERLIEVAFWELER